MTWPLGVSLLWMVLSLVALGVFGLNMVLVYLFALSVAASFLFWRESSPFKGKGHRGESGE